MFLKNYITLLRLTYSKLTDYLASKLMTLWKSARREHSVIRVTVYEKNGEGQF